MTDLPDGWLTDDEADLLREIAHGNVVLELGAWKGRSTIVLAETAKLVVSIDRHQPFTHFGVDVADETLDAYLHAVRGIPNIVPVIGEFSAAELFDRDVFNLVWLDGVHDFDNVVADLKIAGRFNCPTVLHDWGRYEVKAAAESLGLTATILAGSIAMIDR